MDKAQLLLFSQELSQKNNYYLHWMLLFPLISIVFLSILVFFFMWRHNDEFFASFIILGSFISILLIEFNIVTGFTPHYLALKKQWKENGEIPYIQSLPFKKQTILYYSTHSKNITIFYKTKKGEIQNKTIHAKIIETSLPYSYVRFRDVPYSIGSKDFTLSKGWKTTILYAQEKTKKRA